MQLNQNLFNNHCYSGPNRPIIVSIVHLSLVSFGTIICGLAIARLLWPVFNTVKLSTMERH